MQRLFHIIFAVALITGIGYGGYTAYNAWWGTGDIGGKMKTITDNAQETVEKYAGQSIEQTKKYAEESLEKAKTSAEKKITETIEDYSKKAMVSALTSLENKLRDLAQSIAGTSTITQTTSGTGGGGISNITGNNNTTVPQPTASVFLVPPPATTIISKKNTALIFSINAEGIYAINWGDEKTEGGENKKDQVKFVEHSWTKEGDYTMQIIIKNGEQTNIYPFPVRIYE